MRIVVCLAIVVMTTLWLKELSQRLARHRADAFMGPLLTVYTCTEMRMYPWFVDTHGRTHGPTWLASYDSDLLMVDSPPRLYVSLFGGVTDAYNITGLAELVGLSDDDRQRKEWSMIQAFNKERQERQPNRPSQGMPRPARQP